MDSGTTACLGVAELLNSRKDIDHKMPAPEINKTPALPRILVAHDDVGTLRLVRETLEGFTTCRVDTTPNAQYAFELALQREYRLFIFGLGLAVISGELLYGLLVTAFPLCHSGTRACPGVVYIGDAGHSARAEILQREARVKGVLLKPLSVDRIIDRVKTVTALKLQPPGSRSSE